MLVWNIFFIVFVYEAIITAKPYGVIYTRRPSLILYIYDKYHFAVILKSNLTNGIVKF